MYVYCYHVPSIHCIKIGKGFPAARMHNYTKTYGLTPDTKSLRSWETGLDETAGEMESHLHERIQKTFPRRDYYGPNGQTSRELFDIGNRSYAEALLVVKKHVADIQVMQANLDEEVRNIQKEENRLIALGQHPLQREDKIIAKNDRYAAELRADAAIQKFKKQYGDLTLDVDVDAAPDPKKPASVMSWIGFMAYCLTAAPALAAIGTLILLLLTSALGIAENGYAVFAFLFSPFFFFGGAVHWGHKNIIKTA